MDLPMQCFTAAHWVAKDQSLVLEIATTTDHHASFASDPRITVFTGPGATHYSLPTVPGAVLADDVPVRDGGAADGVSGTTVATEGPKSGAVSNGFAGLQMDALLVD
jgi:hypothetical protein